MGGDEVKFKVLKGLPEVISALKATCTNLTRVYGRPIQAAHRTDARFRSIAQQNSDRMGGVWTDRWPAGCRARAHAWVGGENTH